MTPKDVAISLYIDGLTSDYNDMFNKLNEVPMLFMVRESCYPQVQEWLKINAVGAKIQSNKDRFNLKVAWFQTVNLQPKVD